MSTLRDVGPTKLLPPERELIRDVADALLFCGDPASDTAQLALLEAEALVRHLARSGRWTSERAERLHADLRACGPAPAPSALPRAA